MSNHPDVIQVARDLGVNGRDDRIAAIQGYAVDQVHDWIESSPVEVDSLQRLLELLCSKLDLTIEHLRQDDDLQEIAEKHGFSEVDYRALRAELDDPDTDGWLLRNPDLGPGDRSYLAVVDGRGKRQSRAYFTAWHEVTHLIVTPPQPSFEGFYRSIPADRQKDPVESVVDAVAGELAFFEPLVEPVLREQLSDDNWLDFDDIEVVRRAVAPDASLYATAIACVNLADQAAAVVRAEMAYKKEERRAIESPQERLGLDGEEVPYEKKLRAVDVVANDAAREAGLALFDNMRVPSRSVIATAHKSKEDVRERALEDQRWWQASGARRPPLRLHVDAVRKGDYVYGVLAPASGGHDR